MNDQTPSGSQSLGARFADYLRGKGALDVLLVSVGAAVIIGPWGLIAVVLWALVLARALMGHDTARGSRMPSAMARPRRHDHDIES